MGDAPRTLAWLYAIPALLLTVLAAGCNGVRIEPLPPRDAREAIARINDNLSRIRGALYCPGRASFRFRDTEGRDRDFPSQKATVIFEAPRCLYFDIKHSLVGSVAHIGSNHDDYWFWIDIQDKRKLWRGSWQALDEGRARHVEGIPPPSQLLDALMMRPLPEQLPDGSKPLLLIGGNQRRLLFLGLDELDWPFAQRELVLDANPPYLPVEIVDRLRDGRVAMRARLKGYKPVRDAGRNGPYTARRFDVDWEIDQAQMRLELSDVRYRTRDVPFCESPDGWEGEVDSLDILPDIDPARDTEEGMVRP